MAVNKYMQCVLKQIEKHGMWQKVTNLQARSGSREWNQDDVQQWEMVDRLLAQARAFAENKCGTKKSGLLPWSPELKHSGETLLYWKLRHRTYTSRTVNQCMLDCLASDCKISVEEVAWLSCTNIQEKVKEARKATQAGKVERNGTA